MKSLLFVLVLHAFSEVYLGWAQPNLNVQGETSPAQTSGTPITLGETWSLHSKRLGEEREIQIYLPPSYGDSNKHFPVIYTLDGEGLGPLTASAMQFLTQYPALPLMPEALVVAVINTNRNRDMPIPQEYGRGGEDNFLSFLADELIPAIEQRYRTQRLRILGGHSQGGLFAHYALTARPDAFQWYLSMDAPLSGFPDVKPIMERVKKQVALSPTNRGRLVSIETLYGWKKEWKSFISVAPKSFYGEEIEIKDETHETMAYKGIYEGLKHLFHDYTLNLMNESKGIFTLPILEERYKNLSEDYGYNVEIPKQLLLTTASQNVAMQYGAEAIELINSAITLYGKSPATKQLLATAEEAVKKGRDPRLNEWMNLPMPIIEEMKPYFGIWKKTEHDNTEVTITFEVKDGVVRAEDTVTPTDGKPFHREIQFVRVLNGETLQWGVRNGKGAGIILHTGKLSDANTLRGTIEPVGIEHAPPPHPFIFKRQTGVGQK